jgi:hypothetical protein
MKKGATAIAIITGALGAIIVGLSLYYFFSLFALRRSFRQRQSGRSKRFVWSSGDKNLATDL